MTERIGHVSFKDGQKKYSDITGNIVDEEARMIINNQGRDGENNESP